MVLNDRGFSLIEVLIAIVLLSIGLLGVAGMQSTAISGNLHAQTGTLAVQMAEEMVDRIRANAGNNPLIYHDLDTQGTCTGTGSAAVDCSQWQARLQASGLSNIRGRVTVVQDSPLENSATITVRVDWGESAGIRSVVLTTILETWGT